MVDSFSAFDVSISFSLSFFSFSLEEKSNPEPEPEPEPGVLGVFDCPNEAKAPLPRPKADDPPGVIPGDFAEAGEAVLNGFDLPCDDLAPKARGESLLPLSLESLVSKSLVGNVILSLVLNPHQYFATLATEILTLIFVSTSWLDP